MDWGDSAELHDIFMAEVADRAGGLLQAARAMQEGTYVPSTTSDRTRDAHTIKGSSRVMGFDYAADAAEQMEELWRRLESGALPASRDLGSALEQVITAMQGAVDEPSDAHLQTLNLALANLRRTTGGDSPEEGGRLRDPIQPGDAPAAAEDDADPAATPAAHQLTTETVVDLGGLLSSLHDHLTGGNMRIDSGKLYQMINRSVELRLDVQALSETVDRVLDLVATIDPDLSTEFAKMCKMVEASLYDIQERALDLASVRLKEITSGFPQLMRYVARKTGKEVRFEVYGEDLEIDRQILERLHEPVRHLLVNAIDHGIEPPLQRQAAGKPPTGHVALRVSAVGNRLELLVQDDGAGIDWAAVRRRGLEGSVIDPEQANDQSELARLLFLPGFSTRGEPAGVSGDGTGLAGVAALAESLKGGLAIDSTAGVGTTISLTLPVTLAMQDVVLVEAEGQPWGIPAAAVAASFPIVSADIVAGNERIELIYGGRRIPIASFASAVGLPETEPVEHVLVMATRLGHFGLTIPRISARRQVAVKGISPLLGGVGHVTGAALLGAGMVVAILEPNQLIERVRSLPSPVSGRPRILVVDDSTSVRQLVAAALSSHGFEVVVAAGVEPATKRLEAERFDAMIVDYQMPGSDGVDLVKQVRSRYPVLPIVMVSGVADHSDQDRAWSAGVSAYLDKFDLRQGALAQTLRSLLNLDVASRAEGD